MAIFAACRRTRGNDYILVSPGEHGAVDIFSAGPDAEAREGANKSPNAKNAYVSD